MKILIVTDKFYPKPLANAICAWNLAKEFQNKGNQVSIIAYKDVGVSGEAHLDGTPVYYVRPDLRLQLFYNYQNNPHSALARVGNTAASLLSKTIKLLFLKWNPLVSLSFPKRIERCIEKLYVEEQFDIVISVFAQFENALAAMWFKKNHPECKWCLYALDTFINQRQTWVPENLRRMGHWVPQFMKYTDMFLYMKSREQEYEHEMFDPWRHKMYETDIPLLTKVAQNLPLQTSSAQEEHWVYAGSLGLPHYDYTDAVKCFLALPEGKRRFLHVYSNGIELEKLKQIPAQNGNQIVCHDYVNHAELAEIYSNADVLFSMKSSSQISAKIFEYMSFKKKVIHFSGCPEDPNVQYVDHYRYGCTVRTYQNTLEESIEMILNCIAEPIDYSDKDMGLASLLKNTPEYTCNLITHYISN